MDGQADKQMDRWMSGRMNEWMDRQIDGWIDGWMEAERQRGKADEEKAACTICRGGDDPLNKCCMCQSVTDSCLALKELLVSFSLKKGK